MENALTLNNISFSYKNSDSPVIKNFSLDVEKGSFTTLLGSSGSGKTTLLRLISGFLEPTEGEILINDEKINEVRPEKRKIGMVFQDYALFPHLSVEENILYGLKLKNKNLPKNHRKTKEEINEKIISTAKILNLESLLNRYPSELSGGQQQRVALGRALVLEPEILLMDEPLSSLDTNLRITVRNELKEIQQRLKITTIYVTHDQEEALSLSDKIAVLNEGKITQYGTSRQIYFNPADKFTAELGGKANFINLNGESLMIRPEWIKLHTEKKSENSLSGTIISCEFLGSKLRYKIQTETGIIIADTSSTDICDYKPDTKIFMDFMFKKKL